MVRIAINYVLITSFPVAARESLKKSVRVFLSPGFQELCSTLSILYVTFAKKYRPVYAPFVPTCSNYNTYSVLTHFSLLCG